jgi:hypothetical protein
VWIIAIWFLLRGIVAIVRTLAVPMMPAGYLIFTITTEGLVYLVLGIGLLRSFNFASVGAMIWSVVVLGWASYGFIVSSSWRSSARLTLYVFTVGINLLIILFLARVRWRAEAPNIS